MSDVKDSRWLNAELGVGGSENMLIPEVDCALREWLLLAVVFQFAGGASRNSTAALD